MPRPSGFSVWRARAPPGAQSADELVAAGLACDEPVSDDDGAGVEEDDSVVDDELDDPLLDELDEPEPPDDPARASFL